MTTISSMSDLRTWILNANPNNVLSTPERVEPLAEALRQADHPAWGEDWEEWLSRVTSDDMPGTRANPMPGASGDAITTARAAWAAADTITQGERNESARREGIVIERDAAGYVID